MKVVQRGFGEHLDERDRARQLQASCDYRAQGDGVEPPEATPVIACLAAATAAPAALCAQWPNHQPALTNAASFFQRDPGVALGASGMSAPAAQCRYCV